MPEAALPRTPRPRALGGTPWRGADAAEAVTITLGELAERHRPVLPELPDRGPGADAAGRSAALLTELSVDLQPHGWRVSPPSAVSSGMDRRRAQSFWREDLLRWTDTAGAEGLTAVPLAVRVLGPLSLLGSLWLPGGERVLVDAGARRDVVGSYREGLASAVDRWRAATGAAQVGVVVDEPLAAAVLAGELATASGYRTVRSMPRDEARAAWRDTFEDLVGAGVDQLWLDPHAGEAVVVDLALLATESLPHADDAPPVRLSLSVGALEAAAPGRDGRPPAGSPAATPRAWDVVAGWIDAGRGLALRGVRPAELLRTWDRLGLDPALAAGLDLADAGPATAAGLRRLRQDAEELEARVRELLG